MKQCAIYVLALCTLTILPYTAASVNLYVDSAPNVYGSPDWPAWQSAAYAAATGGSFINMANGINSANVGTTNFEIQDEVVYSFGDLGKRLHWIYWIPGETVADLSGRFEIRLENWWDGDYDDFYLGYYGSTWLVPGAWIDYDADGDGEIDGVIGSAGMAWWGADGVNTEAALDADLAAWIQADEVWTFTARLDGQEYSITSYREGVPVPAPGALLMGSIGVGLVSWLRRRRTL